ncbi:MAG: twin-arginine translocation signal domain-containing protein, partial [Ginsengibacter sp.]
MKRRDLIKDLAMMPLAGGIVGSAFPFQSFAEPALKEPTAANIYDSLGVQSVINGRGTVTIIGACRMLPEVEKAMKAATRHYVQLDELMEGAGKKLAELTGAEWGIVTTGATGALIVG